MFILKTKRKKNKAKDPSDHAIFYVSHTYRIEPHHPEDPDGEGKVDHQNDDEQQHKQVEATLPPAIDADLVDVVRHRPG